MRDKLYAAISILIGIALALAVGEAVCRFLPINDGLKAMPVNASAPVFHFTPNRNVTWSRDWNFSIVNRIHVNNAGYVNDQNYDVRDPRPLLAVVGDSFVEAAMVRPSDTLQGRLSQALAPAIRVYSFAASGAPLSQYLAWAREAHETWKAQALIIVVVGNDFDESLAIYKQGQGFHLYVAGANGALHLQRFDYEPSLLRLAVRKSALARYFLFNLQAHEHLPALANKLMSFVRPARADIFVGNTSASTDPDRLRWSKAAMLAFLHDLSAYAGWPPGSVLFVVDGIRYPTDNPAVAGSYFVQMREFFIAAARRAGYEAIDMDPAFFAHYRATGERFEFPTDGHWNGLAHKLAAEAALHSALLSKWKPTAAQASR